MTEQDYNVRFIGDYFSMTVSVQGVEGDEDLAVDLAANIIEYQYGWDVRKASTIDIEVEPA